MEKILQTLRYLAKTFTDLAIIGFLSMLGALAVTDLIFYLTDRYNDVHLVVTLTSPMDVTAAVFALINGLVLYIINFKVALANGITRKTFFLANLPAAALVAAAMALFNALVVHIHRLFWPVIMTSSLTFTDAGVAGLVIYLFTLYLMLIVLGWFISMAYYRSSTAGKWAISLSPVVLYALLRTANARFDGAVFPAIGEFLRTSLGLVTGNPYQAASSLLIFTILLYGLVYLLIRRAPLKV